MSILLFIILTNESNLFPIELMFNWAHINLFTFLSFRFLKISFGSPVWADSVYPLFRVSQFLFFWFYHIWIARWLKVFLNNSLFFSFSAIFRRKQGVKVEPRVQTLYSSCVSKKLNFPKIIQILFFSPSVLYLVKISAKSDHSISASNKKKKKRKEKKKESIQGCDSVRKNWNFFTWQP